MGGVHSVFSYGGEAAASMPNMPLWPPEEAMGEWPWQASSKREVLGRIWRGGQVSCFPGELAAVKWRDKKIQGLEEQVCDALMLIQFCKSLGDLIMHIESQKVIDEPPKDSVASEIKGGTVLPIEPSSSSCKKNRRRN
ncbi:hypothetical protein ZIOFF_036049 [Zingiber officinale]|uniref:Uncharacterized protein n=1 Tax=Zingiber officinale TaxID=94328 RepID=A0A8J5L7L2_ZINOF|nr:hypothetical protein ZIOFF_036049 [Zingiber officinale]